MRDGDAASPSILLVDDEPLILSAYRRTLWQQAGHIRLARSADEGLALLEQEPADVVVADYRMPGTDGATFLQQVRQRWPETVRLLLTASTDLQMVEEVVARGGIFRFLTKPCEAYKLREAVSDAVAHGVKMRESAQRSTKLKLDLHSYQHIFQSAFDLMMVADLDGNVVQVNEAFLKEAEGDLDEALRRRPTILSGREVEDACWPEIRAAVDRHGHWSGPVREGDRHALLSISLIRDDEGHPYAYAAVEKDITVFRRLEEQTRAAQYEVILALAKLAEYRDPETGAHLERMRRYSRVLADTMSRMPGHAEIIDAAYVEAIFMSAPLHDIGKVGIPDAVLLKPGKLTREEWLTMTAHARIGADVLAAAGETLSQKTWLAMGRTIALQHHEKMDGSGYPQGLTGPDIDLSARIVALADAYDAITSRRVYKDALPHDVARARIVESAGTHFDPDVVEAFLESEQAFIAIRRQFHDEELPLLAAAGRSLLGDARALG